MARRALDWRRCAAPAMAGLFAMAAGASVGQAPNPAPPRDFSRARQSVVDYSRGVAAPAASCAALKTGFSPGISILSADEVAAAGGAPAYCHVVALVEGRIRIEVALPASWNRRLMQIGNGGMGGEAVPGVGERANQRAAALRNGFVFTSNDMGHVAAGESLAWAENKPDAVVDFGHRAAHLDNVWARRVAERYYGNTVARAYYAGCSTGGRQGYSEAQRYPADFDGILAGAPVFNLVSLSVVNTANAAALARSGLTAEAYGGVAQRMLAKCDGLDGVKDGVIADPRQCRFDVATEAPICGQAGATAGQCITPAQAAVLKAMTAEVQVGKARVYPGKVMSAENMARLLPSARAPNPASRETADQVLRSMALYPKMGPYPQLSWQTVDVARDFNRVQPARAVLEATNPDLSAFVAHGGKMITYVGWEDTGINPRALAEYADAVGARIGKAKADEATRLFMVPGMGHCQGGAGAADYFDMMTPLIEWVEAGVAPQSVIATKRAPDGTTSFSRRLCPHPQVARYGGGDDKDAASYTCQVPSV